MFRLMVERFSAQKSEGAGFHTYGANGRSGLVIAKTMPSP